MNFKNNSISLTIGIYSLSVALGWIIIIKLPIVVIVYGWWNNIPREFRTCHLCNAEDLGDEYHYLLTYGYFTDKRMTYIAKKYFNNYNILKFGDSQKNLK